MKVFVDCAFCLVWPVGFAASNPEKTQAGVLSIFRSNSNSVQWQQAADSSFASKCKSTIGARLPPLNTRGGNDADEKDDANIAMSSNINQENPNADISAEPQHNPKKEIEISKVIDLPLDIYDAFDRFADLPFHGKCNSPFLSKVEYDPNKPPVNHDFVETPLLGHDWPTKWYLKLFGLVFTFNAIMTQNDRPKSIQWKSISGVPNWGKVRFEPIPNPPDNRNTKNVNNDEETSPSTTQEVPTPKTRCTIKLTFIAPRIIAMILKRSSVIASFIQNRVVQRHMEALYDIQRPKKRRNKTAKNDKSKSPK